MSANSLLVSRVSSFSTRNPQTITAGGGEIFWRACFTLTTLQALAPYTTQCVGIDLSENMVGPRRLSSWIGHICPENLVKSTS